LQFTTANGHDDPDETELPDDAAARQEALRVVGDLKKNNESAWNGWSIDVTEGERRVWQIPFREAD